MCVSTWFNIIRYKSVGGIESGSESVAECLGRLTRWPTASRMSSQKYLLSLLRLIFTCRATISNIRQLTFV